MLDEAAKAIIAGAAPWSNMRCRRLFSVARLLKTYRHTWKNGAMPMSFNTGCC